MKADSDDRWASYVQVTGEAFVNFLRDHADARDKERKVCLILGKGFDPRMLEGFKALCQVFSPAEIAVILIVFDEGPTSPSLKYDQLVKRHVAELKK